MPQSLTLVIGTPRFSSWSLRPFLALKAAGAEFTTVEIALRQPDTKGEILKWSPSGKVPLLVQGAVKIWDSLAICEAVAEMFPAANLWPTDPAARAVARSVAAEMHSGFPNLRNVCPMDFGATLTLTEIPAEVEAECNRIRQVWSDCRAQFGQGGTFLFGKFSIADAMYAPVASRFTTYNLSVDSRTRAYCETVMDLPSIQDWRRMI